MLDFNPSEYDYTCDDEREAAINIINTLRSNDSIAYLAGGCVRDQLLGVVPKDYDVATSAHPEHIAELFKKTAAVGAAFGVMLVRDFGPTIEVATFRSDGPYSDARRPDHVHYSSPAEDAQRRDFTINALFLDPSDDGDKIIDFVDGQADIKARILRAVGDPDARLKEDHLRALRAVRFAARYELAIDSKTNEAIKAHASDLKGVSVERIGGEIRNMMEYRSRPNAAKLVQSLGLDKVIFGGPCLAPDLPTLTALSDDAHPIVALTAWAYDRIGPEVLSHTGAIESRWASKLDLSNLQREFFVSVLDISGLYLNNWKSKTQAQRKRICARRFSQWAMFLAMAIDEEATQDAHFDSVLFEHDGIGLSPEPLITGQTLIDMGHTPGQTFKEVLDRVYDAQLEGKIVSFESARNLAQELFVKLTQSDH